jgi:hypothetical protein
MKQIKKKVYIKTIDKINKLGEGRRAKGEGQRAKGKGRKEKSVYRP